MTERGEVRYGNARIGYSVVRSARRRKTIEITLDPTEGVLVAVPASLPAADIQAVVERRAGWILQRAEDSMLSPAPKMFVSGETLPYQGREVRMEVTHADVPRVKLRFLHWAFMVTVPANLDGEVRREAVRRAFLRWYRRRALERVRSAVDRWSAAANAAPARVIVRDQRQRWGSCGRDGTLRFNWRVVLAEPTLIDYVVVHELLHLEHRTHSREYWAAVNRVMPDYALRRARLREVGARLTF